MSHLGTRLLSERMADDDEGVNVIAQEVPLHGTDAAPPEVTIYDDTQDDWVMRGMVPLIDQGIEFPCIRLMTLGVEYEAGVAQEGTDVRFVAGTLRVGVQLILRDDDETRDAAIAGMYLLRAIRGVISRFDDPANQSAREFGGIRLDPSLSISQGKMEGQLGETLVSPGAFIVTYPFLETVPLPLSLH